MKQQDRIAAIEAFVETARRGSFVAAAQALGIDVSSVSRRVSALERRLAVRLLQRSTRRLSLTQAGLDYFARGAEVLAHLNELDESIEGVERQPRGVLRIALPNAFGREVVLPAIPEFLARYPGIEVDLHFSDAYVDIVGHAFDLAVRIGNLKDSGLVARRIGTYRRFLCAAPSYLQRAGTPETPADLADHQCLNFLPLAGGANWELHGPGGPTTVAIRSRLRANDVQASHIAALRGLGIAGTADFVAQAAVAAGQLVQVLPRWRFADAHVYVIHPSARYLPARVLAFREHLESVMTDFADGRA
jgi:DNA-binding transcriptional LysR family regulator